jgi:hypothetical protein
MNLFWRIAPPKWMTGENIRLACLDGNMKGRPRYSANGPEQSMFSPGTSPKRGRLSYPIADRFRSGIIDLAGCAANELLAIEMDWVIASPLNRPSVVAGVPVLADLLP